MRSMKTPRTRRPRTRTRPPAAIQRRSSSNSRWLVLRHRPELQRIGGVRDRHQLGPEDRSVMVDVEHHADARAIGLRADRALLENGEFLRDDAVCETALQRIVASQ